MTGLTPDKVRALLKGATHGPWAASYPGQCCRDGFCFESHDGKMQVGHGFECSFSDHLLIAAAPDLARAYLTQAAALERVHALANLYDRTPMCDMLADDVRAALAGPTPSSEPT